MDDEPVFRSPDVCRLTGVTYRQLDYWSRLGGLFPAVPARGSGTQRLWTWQQVVIVRVISVLSQHGASMATLGVVSATLEDWALDGMVVVCGDGYVERVTDIDRLCEGWIVDLGAARRYVGERLDAESMAS